MLTRVTAAAGLFRRGKLGRLEKLVAYGATRTAAEGLAALRQLALAGILGPQLFGAWALFRILMSFYPLAALGSIRALEVEVSWAGADGSGKDLARRQAAWGQALLGFLVAIFVPVSAATALVAAWLPEGPLRLALGGVAATILLDRLWEYAYTYLRSLGQLRRFAIVETFHALLQAALTTVLALVWGLQGAYVGMIVAIVVAISLLARSVPTRPALSATRTINLVRRGLPLCLSSLLVTALMTADRMVVGALAGIDDLGRYAFAVSLASVGMAGANVIRAVIFPDVYGSAAVSGIAQTTRAHVESTLRPFASVLSMAAGFAALALGPAIAWILPSYADTVVVAQLFIYVGLAQGLTTLTTLGIIAVDHQRILPLLSLAAFVFTVLVSVAALEAGLGLIGVAAGALAARTAGAAGLIIRLLGIAGLDAPLRTSLTVVSPLAWCSLTVAAVGYAVPPTDLVTLAMAWLLYTALITPLAVATRPIWLRPVRKLVGFLPRRSSTTAEGVEPERKQVSKTDLDDAE
jgi:O-antigen/teichoic acid export membrane protein